MQKTRTQNSRQPRPRIFSQHFEQLIAIMREQPERFRRVRPETKRQLSTYLDLKGGAL
jgi:hypothetical protein